MGRGQEDRQADSIPGLVTVCMFMCWKGNKNCVCLKTGMVEHFLSLFLNHNTTLGLSMQAMPFLGDRLC